MLVKKIYHQGGYRNETNREAAPRPPNGGNPGRMRAAAGFRDCLGSGIQRCFQRGAGFIHTRSQHGGIEACIQRTGGIFGSGGSIFDGVLCPGILGGCIFRSSASGRIGGDSGVSLPSGEQSGGSACLLSNAASDQLGSGILRAARFPLPMMSPRISGP